MEDDPQEQIRCQLCTRDAVLSVSGQLSGEQRTFLVCGGCADELRRIRRTWAIGLPRRSEDEHIVIPRTQPGYEGHVTGPFTLVRPGQPLPKFK